MLRLALAFALIALLTSRVTLVVHELVGHGAVAEALGADVTELHLFVFAGGYIRFARAAPFQPWEQLAVQLGGIALELAISGALLWLARRRRGALAVGLAGFGAINAVHGLYYLAAGAFHGFGDGRYLRWWLGGARVPFAIAAGAACVAAAYLGARELARAARPSVPGRTPAARAAALWAAVLTAGGAHAALTFGEIAIAPRPSYEVIMERDSERAVQRDLARFERERAAEGAPPAADELARERARLQREHRELPFHVALAALAIAAAALASYRACRGDAASERLRVGALAAAAAGSVALVVIARAVFGLPGGG